MKKLAKWGVGLLALLCAFGLGSAGSSYTETDLALAREEAYNSGYHAGYAQGETARQEAVYTEGFSAGRLQGYDEGFAEGLQNAAAASRAEIPAEPDVPANSLPVFTPFPVDDPAPDRGLPSTEPAAQDPVGQVVYVTKSGTKYHVSGCSHLSKSKIEKSLADAKNAGYEPCKTCKPPQ